MLFHFTVEHEHICMLLFNGLNYLTLVSCGVVSTTVFRDLLRALYIITLDWVV